MSLSSILHRLSSSKSETDDLHSLWQYSIELKSSSEARSRSSLAQRTVVRLVSFQADASSFLSSRQISLTDHTLFLLPFPDVATVQGAARYGLARRPLFVLFFPLNPLRPSSLQLTSPALSLLFLSQRFIRHRSQGVSHASQSMLQSSLISCPPQTDSASISTSAPSRNRRLQHATSLYNREQGWDACM